MAPLRPLAESALVLSATLLLTVASASNISAMPQHTVVAPWAESHAEAIVLTKLRVPCRHVRTASDCSIAKAQGEVAAQEKFVAACKALGDPQRTYNCLTNIVTRGNRDPTWNLARVRNGFLLATADCLGSGPADATGFRFARFRCKVSIDDEDVFGHKVRVTGHVAIFVTGNTTFRWQVI